MGMKVFILSFAVLSLFFSFRPAFASLISTSTCSYSLPYINTTGAFIAPLNVTTTVANEKAGATPAIYGNNGYSSWAYSKQVCVTETPTTTPATVSVTVGSDNYAFDVFLILLVLSSFTYVGYTIVMNN